MLFTLYYCRHLLCQRSSVFYHSYLTLIAYDHNMYIRSLISIDSSSSDYSYWFLHLMNPAGSNYSLKKELLYIKEESSLYPKNEVVVIRQCQVLGSESAVRQGKSG